MVNLFRRKIVAVLFGFVLMILILTSIFAVSLLQPSEKNISPFSPSVISTATFVGPKAPTPTCQVSQHQEGDPCSNG